MIANGGGSPPIETTSSPIMIARTITGKRFHKRFNIALPRWFYYFNIA
jgi:hypothetical protein